MVARRRDCEPTTAVIDQAIDRLLKHPLFVADDDLRSTKLEKPLEPVVAVDDAAVKIVEVTCGEAAAVQLDHRAQVRRQDRENAQHHPGGPVAALAQGFDDAKAL